MDFGGKFKCCGITNQKDSPLEGVPSPAMGTDRPSRHDEDKDNSTGDKVDVKFGFARYVQGKPRTGWLFTMRAVSHSDIFLSCSPYPS